MPRTTYDKLKKEYGDAIGKAIRDIYREQVTAGRPIAEVIQELGDGTLLKEVLQRAGVPKSIWEKVNPPKPADGRLRAIRTVR